MIDYLLFPFKVLRSLLYCLWDALVEWKTLVIVHWRIIECKRHPERMSTLNELKQYLDDGTPEFEVGDRIRTWEPLECILTWKYTNDAGETWYEGDAVNPRFYDDGCFCRAYEMEKVEERK